MPEEICVIEKKCEKCIYFKPDYGIWCFNGWSGDGSTGWCNVFPDKKTKKNATSKCIYFEIDNA